MSLHMNIRAFRPRAVFADRFFFSSSSPGSPLSPSFFFYFKDIIAAGVAVVVVVIWNERWMKLSQSRMCSKMHAKTEAVCLHPFRHNYFLPGQNDGGNSAR